MSNENEWNLVAPCGLYCGECVAPYSCKFRRIYGEKMNILINKNFISKCGFYCGIYEIYRAHRSGIQLKGKKLLFEIFGNSNKKN